MRVSSHGHKVAHPLHLNTLDISARGRLVFGRTAVEGDDDGLLWAKTSAGSWTEAQEAFVPRGRTVTRVRFADETWIGWLEHGDRNLRIADLDNPGEIPHALDVGNVTSLVGAAGWLAVSGANAMVVDARGGDRDWVPEGEGQRAVGLDPEAKFVAVADAHRVRVFERADHGEVAQLPLTVGAPVDEVALSADARFVAVRSSRGNEEVVIFDVRSGARVVEDLYAAFTSLMRFSADGRRLALAYNTGVVHWADLEEGVHGTEKCGDRLSDLAFDPQGTLVVASRPQVHDLVWSADGGTVPEGV